MNSEVSREKPQALLVRQIAAADARRQGRRQEGALGRRARRSCTPARRRRWCALVEAGFVDVLFAGNALATHDIESSLLRHVARASTCRKGRASSTATSTTSGRSTRSAGAGSIAAAVEQGVLTCGVMHALVAQQQAVRPGRLGARRRAAARRLHRRDRGPARDARRAPGVGFAIMVATMLHSIATGNILPASVPLVCVDINPATVTKLADRGSAQAQRHRHRHRAVPRAAGAGAGPRLPRVTDLTPRSG